ncbi:MAG TPA: amidohydrolase [Candidatus Binatia bacterium]|nr:amidohydrolase [Candidatus Binatia bacterium]
MTAKNPHPDPLPERERERTISYPTADLLLHGGRVLTLNPSCPAAEAIAISAGKILAVGTERELGDFVSPHTQLLACGGRTILPGFIDPHLHLFSWASRFCGIDLSVARSIPEIRRLLANRSPSISPGEWLRGYGYDEFFLTEKRHPTREDLDLVSPDSPVILRHRTGHAAVLNSVGLRQAGIHRDFVPSGGGNIGRNALSGEPTGVVYELEQFLRTILPPLTANELAAGVKRANTELLRRGVTSFHDASAGNTLEDLALFRRFSSAEMLSSRATVMIGSAALPQVVEDGLSPFSGDEYVRLGSVKIMLHESRGELYPQPDDLAALVLQPHRHGFQVAFHAVEEGPICAALAAIAQAQRCFPRTDHRHRIEHCALCPPPFIDELAETGSAVVIQPGFLYFYGEKYVAEVDPDIHSWLYRTKSLLERGVPVAGSSDCPVSPLAPLIGIQVAITRRSRSGIAVNPRECLSLPEALSLFTSAGAWIGFEETQKGRIMPGMLADLVVLDGDLTAVPVEEIGSLKVTMTLVGGKIVWAAERSNEC